MAYRVVSESAQRWHKRPRADWTLTRNATIAAASLLSVSLVAAGAAIFGNSRGFEAPSDQIASRNLLRIALVDPAPPKIVRRDPRIVLATPGPHLWRVAVAHIPLPAPRPAQMASIPLPPERLADTETTGSIGQPARETAAAASRPAHEIAVAAAKPVRERPAPVKPPHKQTAFEKLYGPVRLASLTPADTGREDDSGLPRAPFDHQTAVYVIADKKVYMPDGTVLEAHSGLGDKLDDPRFVNVRMHGATPPHMYDLKLRESLFHGIEAIRLTPVGGDDEIFGRAGLLAHTYMLGPRGDSFGCVSFKDYDAFLEAFKEGKIRRLAVIARVD